MFRNLYDSDVTTWSPQGRLFQLEYSLEAVKQGAAAVGLCSSTHVVLCALKRSPAELASYQKKLVIIDDHIGVAIAGLTSDARVLTKFMQAQALASRMDMNRPIPLQRLVTTISDRAQSNTQHYGGRPFGVGMLIAGYDDAGPHLFEFSPSGNYFDYVAMAIGARSQSARTYLETHRNAFEKATLEELLVHALHALRDTLPPDANPGLTAQNCALGYLGADQMFTVIEDETTLQGLLAKLTPYPDRPPAAASGDDDGNNDGSNASMMEEVTQEQS